MRGMQDNPNLRGFYEGGTRILEYFDGASEWPKGVGLKRDMALGLQNPKGHTKCQDSIHRLASLSKE